HSLKAPRAPIANAAITIALIQAFPAGFRSMLKPRTQGEMKSSTAKARLTRSCGCLFSMNFAMTDLLHEDQPKTSPHSRVDSAHLGSPARDSSMQKAALGISRTVVNAALVNAARRQSGGRAPPA